MDDDDFAWLDGAESVEYGRNQRRKILTENKGRAHHDERDATETSVSRSLTFMIREQMPQSMRCAFVE